MKVLEVSRYKSNFSDHQLPFVTEQGEALRALGCEVEFFLVKGNYLSQVSALKEKIREFRPDIVHAHYGLSAITAELQNLAPVVTTFHNGETHRADINFITSLMSLRAKHVVYVAKHIRDLVYFKNRNYSILPCGVCLADCEIIPKEEARQRLGWPLEKKYVMFGGAFDNLRKGYPLLEAAITHLGRQDVETVEMRGLSRKDCVLRMCACDVFALPTKNEGSPQALKEAMACNCPIVATDVADIRYLLGENIPGHYILANKGNSPAFWEGDDGSVGELAALLDKALSFDGRTEGRKRIVDLGYTNELVARELLSIYKSIVPE